MKLHKNASLTLKNRQQIKDLYTTGEFNQQHLAIRFGVTRKTIAKWINSPTVEDSCNVKKLTKSITDEFITDVKAYRENKETNHHGKVRIARELKGKHACSNPSNVYLVLKQLKLNKVNIKKTKIKKYIHTEKHRTQIDVQKLPDSESNIGFKHKISIVHVSTRIKYFEIHSNADSSTIAGVYRRALDYLPPLL